MLDASDMQQLTLCCKRKLFLCPDGSVTGSSEKASRKSLGPFTFVFAENNVRSERSSPAPTNKFEQSRSCPQNMSLSAYIDSKLFSHSRTKTPFRKSLTMLSAVRKSPCAHSRWPNIDRHAPLLRPIDQPGPTEYSRTRHTAS